MSLWLVSITKENWEILKDTNFKYLGFSDRYIKTLRRVKKGDMIIIYLASKVSVISGLLRVKSKPYGVRKSIWLDNLFNTIDVGPVLILKKDDYVDIKPLLNSLSFVTNKLNWGTYFRKSLREIEHADYKIFEKIFGKIFNRCKSD